MTSVAPGLKYVIVTLPLCNRACYEVGDYNRLRDHRFASSTRLECIQMLTLSGRESFQLIQYKLPIYHFTRRTCTPIPV